MRLNLLYNAPACAPIDVDLCKDQLPQGRRSGSKHPGDSRKKLDSNRAISHEYVHSYFVNDAPSEEVPKTPRNVANPDVSGFVSQVCKDRPRNTSVGDESLSGAKAERNWK